MRNEKPCGWTITFLHLSPFSLLINLFRNFSNGIYRRNGVEVQAGATVGEEFFTLRYAPLNAQLLHLFISSAFLRLAYKRFGKVAMEYLGHNLQLRQSREGFDARDDGHFNSFLTAFIYKTEVRLIVVEKLRYTIFRTEFHLALKPRDVRLQVRRFLVFFGVTRYAIIEVFARHLDGRTVDKRAVVEGIDLLLQLRGVRITIWFGLEHGILFRLIASQHKEVFNTQKL